MGGGKTFTMMVVKVDLKCCKCFKKVKKILCKIPQIQDQEYDEKNGQVKIKVVCCSPEKIKQKIICKGGCMIKSIEIIKKPDTPPPPPTPTPTPQPKPQAELNIAIGVCCQQRYIGYPCGPPCYCYHKSRCCATYFSEENPQGCNIM